jgi:hypothetical protein
MTMTQKQAVAVANSWLQSLDFHVGDASVITGSAWERRGETCGRGAKAIVLIDGSPLYAAFNYGEPSWNISEAFQKMLKERGLWYELAYGWAIAIYED